MYQGSGIDRDRVGCHGHSRGRGPCDHPYGENNHGCCAGATGTDRDEANEARGDHGHDPTQTATKPKEECVPTRWLVSRARMKTCRMRGSPQSSGYRHGRCACCASHSKHRPHRGDPHTRQKRNYTSCISHIILARETRKTYSRLDAERGAGISQRTRRPYLWITLSA